MPTSAVRVPACDSCALPARVPDQACQISVLRPELTSWPCTADNAINGIPACADDMVLNKYMRDEWGFSGWVISDANAVIKVFMDTDGGHMYAPNASAAAATAMKGGCDIAFGEGFGDSLSEAVADGQLPHPTLLVAARRALGVRMRSGDFDPPSVVPWAANADPAVVDGLAHHQLAREVAAASYVLLKHTRYGALALPLYDKTAMSIAVIGPAADDALALINRYTGSPKHVVTMLEGIKTRAEQGEANVTVDHDSGMGANASSAVALCKRSTVAVVVLTATPEGESKDRTTLALPTEQASLLRALSQTGTPLVVVVVSGGPVDVEMAETDPHVIAIIQAGQGGMEGGSALARLLFGDQDFSGALATAVYRESWSGASDFMQMGWRPGPNAISSGGPAPAPPPSPSLGRGHRYLNASSSKQHVLYPFGYGLSYTGWNVRLTGLSEPTISAAELKKGKVISVGVSAQNALNTRAGATDKTVLVYVRRRDDPRADAPVRWLLGFAKLRAVAPGTSATAHVDITSERMARWTAAAAGGGTGGFAQQPGSYEVWVESARGGGQMVPSQPMRFTITK